MIVLWAALGVAGLATLTAAFVWFNNSCLKTTCYKIKLEGADGTRIVHLSDLHGKSFGRHNGVLVKKVAALKPDFIAVTGDIIHAYTERNKAVALGLVGTLKEIAPVVYISGNHEMRNKGYRFFRKDLKEAGAVVLDDESVTVCGICVTGLNAASLRNGKIFKLTPESKQILLAHEPQFINKYAEAGYKVALCGHAHGGQWRIPFTGRGLYAPQQGVFPKYTQGVHICGDMQMVVSRGLGNSRFPLRLFNRPEIVVIDFE